MIQNPRQLIQELDDEGRLGDVFPAVLRCKGVRQSPVKHAEGHVFTHILMGLDKIHESTPSDAELGPISDERSLLLIFLGVLYHDTGKKERNESTNRIDHVAVSIEHAKNDLKGKISDKELEMVLDLIGKHEQIFGEQISADPVRARALFSFNGDLGFGRLLLKFSECDNLGRIVNDEKILEKNRKLIERNIRLYQLLLEKEEYLGIEYSRELVRRRNEVKALIKKILNIS